MRHIQKIILLVLTIPFTLFPGGLILYILFYEREHFEYSMIIPMLITALGLFSVIFHFKTKDNYRLLLTKTKITRMEPIFWILDISFGMAFIITASYLHYMMIKIPFTQGYWYVLAFSLPMFFFGVWVVVEAFYLHKVMLKHEDTYKHSDIEDIKGQQID